jgi:hypothetical protein
VHVTKPRRQQQTPPQVNAAEVGDEPLGEWLHVAGLLLPLYAPRALEVELFGPDAASLATAQPIADAFEVGRLERALMCVCVALEDWTAAAQRGNTQVRLFKRRSQNPTTNRPTNTDCLLLRAQLDAPPALQVPPPAAHLRLPGGRRQLAEPEGPAGARHGRGAGVSPAGWLGGWFGGSAGVAPAFTLAFRDAVCALHA